MKRKVMLCGVVLILGLLALGCGDAGGTPAGNGNPYTETVWTGVNNGKPSNIELTFTDSTWQMVYSDGSMLKGTYTYKDDTVTLTKTDEYYGEWNAATPATMT